MASAKPATYANYATAITSATGARSATPSRWAAPYEFTEPYKEPDAIEWKPAIPPDDNNDTLACRLPSSVNNRSRPTNSWSAVPPPSTSDTPFGNYPDAGHFQVASCRSGEREPLPHTI